MYAVTFTPEADKIFVKLSKKDKPLLRKIEQKIKSICSKPNKQYKFLRKPLQNINRVHIDKHFVLLFQLKHERKIPTFFILHT